MQYHSVVLRRAGEWDKSGMCATSALLLTGVFGWLQPGRPEVVVGRRTVAGRLAPQKGWWTANSLDKQLIQACPPALVPSHVTARTWDLGGGPLFRVGDLKFHN
jgi:hypothetical protein